MDGLPSWRLDLLGRSSARKGRLLWRMAWNSWGISSWIGRRKRRKRRTKSSEARSRQCFDSYCQPQRHNGYICPGLMPSEYWILRQSWVQTYTRPQLGNQRTTKPVPWPKWSDKGWFSNSRINQKTKWLWKWSRLEPNHNLPWRIDDKWHTHCEVQERSVQGHEDNQAMHCLDQRTIL